MHVFAIDMEDTSINSLMSIKTSGLKKRPAEEKTTGPGVSASNVPAPKNEMRLDDHLAQPEEEQAPHFHLDGNKFISATTQTTKGHGTQTVTQTSTASGFVSKNFVVFALYWVVVFVKCIIYDFERRRYKQILFLECKFGF